MPRGGPRRAPARDGEQKCDGGRHDDADVAPTVPGAGALGSRGAALDRESRVADPDAGAAVGRGRGVRSRGAAAAASGACGVLGHLVDERVLVAGVADRLGPDDPDLAVASAARAGALVGAHHARYQPRGGEDGQRCAGALQIVVVSMKANKPVHCSMTQPHKYTRR